MASYILKKQTSKFATIDLSRKSIGTVRQDEDGTFSAKITDDGTSASVRGFATMANAFYAATNALKVFKLNKRNRTNIVAITEGTGNETEEIAQRNNKVHEYVNEYNRSEGRQVMRVVTRRR